MSKTPPHTDLSAEEAALLGDLSAALRSRLDQAAGDGMLVLSALEAAGETDALTGTERAHLEAGRHQWTEAVGTHPGLHAASAQIQEDIGLFNSMWPADLGKDRRPARKRASLVRWPARVGLGLAGVVLAGIFYLTIVSEVTRTTVDAPQAAFEIVTLHDGTQVRLSPGASLTFVPGSDFDRTVSLTGHAYFDVAEHTRRFAVETSTAVTTVLGTRFGIESDASSTEVTLVSGRVAVASRANRNAVVVLDPGERTVVTEGLPANPVPVNVASELAWSDLLVFRESTMQQVADMLAERRGAAIELGPAVGELVVTGTFEPQQSARQILDILAATLGARVSESGPDAFRVELAD